jgi:hypothetical protein
MAEGDDEYWHLERLAKLRKTTLDTVDALLHDPEELTEKYADAFSTALKGVKSDTRTFAKAGRPRGMTLTGAGFEAMGDPPADTRIHDRAEMAAQELRRELKVTVPRALGEGTQLSVKEEKGGAVLVGRDKSNAFACVVRMERGALQDVFVLRADEDVGKNWSNRISRFAHWRKTTRQLNELVSDGTLASAADVFKWCEKL